MVAGTLSSIFMMIAAGLSYIFIEIVTIEQLTDSNSLLNRITESIVEIYKFFYAVFEFFINIINIFPSPFATLLSTFLIIMFSVFIWKLVKAGG